MNELYSKIESLCVNRGIKISHMCAAVGIRSGMISDLKMGRKQTLSVETLSKIADYFGVTVDHLLGKEKTPAEAKPKEKPAADEGSELDRQLIDLLSDLSPEEFSRVVDFVSGLRAARQVAASPHPRER